MSHPVYRVSYMTYCKALTGTVQLSSGFSDMQLERGGVALDSNHGSSIDEDDIDVIQRHLINNCISTKTHDLSIVSWSMYVRNDVSNIPVVTLNTEVEVPNDG